MADELKSEETKTESVEQVKVEETQKEESKGFSQSELDEIVSKRVLRERKKWEDKISEIDVEGYDKWKTQQKDLEIESQKKKGEFEENYFLRSSSFAIRRKSVQRLNQVLKYVKKRLYIQ